MLTTKQKGIISEYSAKLFFMSRGYTVCEPIGDNNRYDFLVEIKNNVFLRFQCKTANLARTVNCINFPCASMRHNETKGNYKAKYTKDEIDYFIVPTENQIYIVPVEECAMECNLHLAPTKSGQKSNIKMAEDYEGEKMLERILSLY